MRVGIGYDAHAADAGIGPVVAACRALRRALLGAAALGADDATAAAGATGQGLPAARGGGAEADEARSLEALATAVRRLEAENYQVVNADALVGTGGDEPDLVAMRARLAEVLHISPSAVSLRGAGTGGVPRGDAEGVVALAVVLIDEMGDTDALHAALRSAG